MPLLKQATHESSRARGARYESRGSWRWHQRAGGGAPADRAGPRAADAAGADAHRGARAARWHHRQRARRRLSRGGGAGLVPVGEAVGAGALPPARRREPAGPHRRSLPQGLRLARRPAASAARRLPAAGADRDAAVRHLVAVHAARQAADGARPRAAARHLFYVSRERGRRKPGGLRPPAARRRGAGARRPAAGRGHLHGRSRRPQPGRHHAALPRGREARPLDHPGTAARAGAGAAARHQRRAVVALRHLRRRHGGARLHPGRALARRRYRPQAARERAGPRGRGLAREDRRGRRLRRRAGDPGHRGPRHGPAGALPRPRPGESPGRDPVLVGGDRLARLSAGRRAASARRLRLRGAAHRGQGAAGRHVLEREVSGPRA